MSNPIFIRCPNPKCQKSNPIPPDELEKEHTCIFCGRIIPPEKRSDESKNKSHKKDRDIRFTHQKSESKPVNKNMRKPMI